MIKSTKLGYRQTYNNTIKFSRDYWNYISKSIDKLNAEKTITIEYKDDNYDYLKDMDDAFDLIRTKHYKVRKISVYAESDEGYIHVVMTNTDKRGEMTLSVSSKFKDKKTSLKYQECLENMYYAPQIFHDGFGFAFTFFTFALFTFINEMVESEFWGTAIGFFCVGSLSYFILYKNREKVNNYIYPKKEIQFWIDETSELKYKTENRKARYKVAAIFALSLLIIWLNVTLV